MYLYFYLYLYLSSLPRVANAGYLWPIGGTYLDIARYNPEISPLKLLQNIILNGDHHQKSASSSALMDQATYLGVPSACFCPTFQSFIAYNVTMITFLFDALSRTQWNSFPCRKKLPGDRICRGPFEHFEHLFSKETETVFQFSSNPSHQQYDIPWINIHNSWNSFSFCFSKIGIRKRASGMNLISDFALGVKRVFSRRGVLTFLIASDSWHGKASASPISLQFFFLSKQPKWAP